MQFRTCLLSNFSVEKLKIVENPILRFNTIFFSFEIMPKTAPMAAPCRFENYTIIKMAPIAIHCLG